MRWVLVGAVAIVGPLILIVAAAHTPPARRYVLARTLQYFASHDLDVNAQSLDYNLLAGTIDLRDVVVRGRGMPEAPAVARVARLSVGISVCDLVAGRYILRHGTIERPEVHLFVDEQGRSNLPAWSSKEPASDSPVTYLIEHFALTDGRLRYEDRRQQLDTQLPIASLTIQGDRAAWRHQTRLIAGPGRLVLHGRDAEIDRIDGSASFDSRALRIERLDLGAAGALVSLGGNVVPFNDPNFDFAIGTRVDVTRLATFAGFNEPVGGIVRAEIKMRGPLPVLTIATKVQSDDLSFRSLKQTQLVADAIYEAAASRTRISRLHLLAPYGRLQGQGQIAFDEKAGASTLEAQVGALDLQAIASALKLPYSAASRVDGRVRASWPLLDYARADGEAALTLTPTRSAPARGVVPIAGSLNASSKAQTVVIDLASVRGMGAGVDGRITLTPRRALDGTLRASTPDIAAVASAAEAFLGRKPGTLIPVPVKGAASIDARIGGSLDQPSVQAAVDAPRVSVASPEVTVSDAAITAQVGYSPDAVVIDRADVAWNDARLQASGRLGLRGRQPAIALKASAQQLQIADVLAAIGKSDLAASGVVAAQANINGTVSNPSGTVTVTASDLKRADDDLGEARVDAVLGDGRAKVHAVADRFKLTGDATIATAAPYSTTAELTVADLDLATIPLPLEPTTEGEPPLAGVVRAKVTAAGPLTAPADGTATATIERLDVKWNGQPIATEGPAIARYANHQVAIDQLVVRALDSTASIRGTLPLDPRTNDGAIDVEARLDLKTLAKYAPPSAGLQAQGAVQVAGKITGSLQRIDPAVTVTVADASIATPSLQPGLTDLAARLETVDGRLRIADVHGRWGAAQLLATGEIPFGWLPENLPVEIPRATGPAKIQASLTGFDLSTIPLSSAANEPSKLTGIVSVRADLEAPRPDVNSLVGQITFPELRADFSGLTLAQREPSAIALNNGEVRVERFSLDGTVGQIDLTGRASLVGDRPIDAAARAKLNVAALSTFTQAVRAAGEVTAEVTATGTMTAPAVRGFAQLANGRVSIRDPQIGLQRLQARVDFTPERVTLSRLDGSLNGGTLSGTGGFALDGTTPRAVKFEFTAKDVALDEPLNLRSLSDANLTITQKQDTYVVGGAITVQEAGLTDNINLDAGILSALTAPPSLELTEERNALLERVRFDITLTNATPIIVDNNLARAEIDTNLRVLGTPYETGLSGRVELAEGSELLLNERRYAVERGIITFIDDRRIAPSVDIRLTTSARNYDVTLEASGTPDDTQTTLTSSPALPEPDILALLVTGRTLDEMRGEEFEVAQSQVLSYVGGRVGSTLGKGLERATGLSTVRIEPNLIANETDPGARLTVGQDLTDEVSLVYSTDLVNSSDLIWIAEYDVTRQFTTRAVRQSDNSYRIDVRHDVRFGGQPEPRRSKRSSHGHVGTVAIAGTPVLPESEIRDRFGFSTGKSYSFFDLRDGLRRVNELYRDHGYLQARVRPQRVVNGDTVDLTLQVTAGPKVDLLFEGYQPSGKLLNQLREIWRRGVFDTQRADDVKAALRTELIGDKYLDPTIEYTLDESGGTTDETASVRRTTFRVTPGVRYERIALAFDGARGIGPDELKHVIKDQKLGQKVFTDPREVTDLLRRVYVERGYLSASIAAPQYDFNQDTRQAHVTVSVTEGPLFTVRNITTAGNQVQNTAALLKEIPLVQGDPYLPSTTEQSLTKLRQIYWRDGYNDVKPAYRLGIDRAAGKVDVQFDIAEGPRSVIANINVQGNDKTSDRLVRGQLELKPGEPLDLAALSRSRKNLYGMGAFALVDIKREEVEAPAAPAETAPKPEEAASFTDAGPQGDGVSLLQEATAAAQATPPAPPANTKPVRVDVSLREVQPWQIRYGGLYDTERGLGGILDVSNHNSLGKARVAGVRTRYDSQTREVRLYLSQPSLVTLPIETIASIYALRERNPSTARADAFNVDRIGVSIQQEKKLRDRYVWSYGYRFERSRTYEPLADVPRPPLLNVSPLTSTLSRDTRDEPLDATQGSFLSQAFSFSPEWLGSDVRYFKYFGQYFYYLPLQQPQRKRFSNEILRPRFVYATGVRLGLANGLAGLEVPLSERFLAGGGTTLRGFAQNAVGPIGTDGVPLGGEAMLVINNELRFPLIGIVDGVTFVDIGNVFERVSDFSVTSLRESAGVGLRLRTPWFLVRFDYGIPLDKQPGESRSRAFFSIGQAF